MIDRPALLVLLAALLLGVVATGAAQINLPVMTFTLAGTVYDPVGRPVVRGAVTIQGGSGFEREVITDNSGRYEVRDLARGRYTLTAVNLDATSQTSDPVAVDVVRSITPRIVTQIYLRNRSEVPETSAGQTVSVGEAGQHVPGDARKLYEKALKFRSKGRFDLAIDALDKALEVHPDYFQALAERGHLRIGKGRVDEAARDFERALELNAGYEPALRGCGICRFSQQRFAEAAANLERATTLASNLPMSFLFLGMADLKLGRREAARAALQRALSLDPIGSVRARVHLADLDIKEGRYAEAIAELQSYLTAVPGSPDAAHLRGVQAQLQAQVKR
jgi:tetratricopeptide (TPR) repeat protein